MNKRRNEIILPEDKLHADLRRRTRRSFLIGGIAAAAGSGAYAWLRNQPRQAYLAWPERRVLAVNAKISEAYLSDHHLMPEYSLQDVGYLKPNGDIGLDDDFNDNPWQVTVKTGAGAPDLKVSLQDIKAMPKVDQITRFCCIEGWSVVSHFSGPRFSDFTRKYFPPGQALPKYVYMATPSGEYFVGLDMKSAMHPQTLLAYEKDGKPLDDDHGAPLRLVIPVKYGIKNIKRISLIQYTDQKPSDYWANDGYDWFAGL
jgi:DMSO/TMAO reductase YedYZ molybdopterin-dependent catalytic subunit